MLPPSLCDYRRGGLRSKVPGRGRRLRGLKWERHGDEAHCQSTLRRQHLGNRASATRWSLSDKDVHVLAGSNSSAPGSTIASEDVCNCAASCCADCSETPEGAYSSTLSPATSELLDPLLTHTGLN